VRRGSTSGSSHAACTNEPEISAIGLQPREIESLRAVFTRHPEIEEVVLFGSMPKGSHRPESDIDLAVRGIEATRIRAEEAKAAEARYARQADDRVRAKDVELEEAHKKLGDVATREAELMKRVRELDEKGREQGVEFERRISEEAARIRIQEAELAERRIQNDREQQRLRDEEARLKEQGLRATIEDLQRKLLQGSQQTQGEAQEVVLRELLVDAFRADTVEDVPRGSVAPT
jgi:predicted nucleotidyltransferase